MTEAVIRQEAYSYGSRIDPKLVSHDAVNVFGGESQSIADWKSLFKHPPTNIRFKRNSGSNRDSKRAVRIPCTSQASAELSTVTSKKPIKIPPPRTASSSSLKSAASKKDDQVFPETTTVVLQDFKQLLHGANHCGGSTGECSSMSSSPTSQTSSCTANSVLEEDGSVVHEEDGNHYGDCSVCGLRIDDDQSGCIAIDKVYHNRCFKCQKCGCNLVGENFYFTEGVILCKEDYTATLDICYSCKLSITDQVIWANNHPYHSTCFKCSDCGACLDGVPFVTDLSEKIYCVEDYHRTFAPRCQTCENPILPKENDPDSKRLIAMNMNFHVGCYLCVECGTSLASKEDTDPQCYPIDQYPLCLDCNKVWTLRRHSSQTETSPETTRLSSLSVQSITSN